MDRIPVCVFAKPPIPGRVKTRLARVLGKSGAARLAAAMLCDVWSVVESVAGAIPVLAAAEPGAFAIGVPNERVWLQAAGDLGWRIESILRRGLTTASAVIALGADSPLLTRTHIDEAIEFLGAGHAVLGPTDDGGFYLLGVCDCPHGMLADVPWSSEETCEQTRLRLQTYGMSVATVKSSFDIDTIAELERLRDELDHLPKEIAPQTRAWLADTLWSAS